ncbi:hypothetical protein FCH31_04055 [Lelliottia amnigena]|uniref:IS1/IS1595 family N-terminal zinc-binding domain-containing protein n=1 Tax=Lelliottia amnigena TaxID=61646 RepID=UPI0015766835|nr:hypothetical protein [Lelliottia amnigena]NTX68624.1 hypothetical protein [Lelliottia amnigena]
MERTYKIPMNVCKSWACPNLGIPNAADYIYPVYRLGYATLECQKCGSLPPLFKEKECDDWFSLFMQEKLGATGQGCPRCYTTTIIRYGHTRAGSPRFQCRVCRYVFTPLQINSRHRSNIDWLLSQLERGLYAGEITEHRILSLAVNWCERHLYGPAPSVTHIATSTLVVPFQGNVANQCLYVVLSTDVHSGKVVQVTTNYCDWKAGASLLYHEISPPFSHALPPRDVEYVHEREVHFMKRSQFDEIQYGSAKLKRNDRGSIIRPAVAIHSHFQRLKRRFPDVIHHYLAHECVLRGGAITAWSAHVGIGKTDLWYIAESATGTVSADKPFRLTDTRRIGWWENVWERWENGEQSKMIGLLTGQRRTEDPILTSLGSCIAFVTWLKKHPWSLRSDSYGPRVVSQHLVALGYIYNQQLGRMG